MSEVDELLERERAFSEGIAETRPREARRTLRLIAAVEWQIRAAHSLMMNIEMRGADEYMRKLAAILRGESDA